MEHFIQYELHISGMVAVHYFPDHILPLLGNGLSEFNIIAHFIYTCESTPQKSLPMSWIPRAFTLRHLRNVIAVLQYYKMLPIAFKYSSRFTFLMIFHVPMKASMFPVSVSGLCLLGNHKNDALPQADLISEELYNIIYTSSSGWRQQCLICLELICLWLKCI